MARGGGRSPWTVSLTASERCWLEQLVRRGTVTHRQVVRAQIVLLAAGGLANQLIARKLGVAATTVRKWRRRCCLEGLDGLTDRPRSGRPRVFPPAVVAEVKAIACELPVTRGVPLGRWSLAELRAEVLAAGLVSD